MVLISDEYIPRLHYHPISIIKLPNIELFIISIIEFEL